MAKHEFLSDDWFAIVDQLVAEYGAEAPPDADILMNLVVVDTPFGQERHMHIGARKGRAHYGIGHAPDADLTLTTDFATARAIFVSGNPQTAMQAFMEGKVKLQGDLTRLMAAQAVGTGPGAPGLATALAEMTA